MTDIYIIPLPNVLRIAVDSVSIDKPMEPKLMRQLAIRLLEAAEESERSSNDNVISFPAKD